MKVRTGLTLMMMVFASVTRNSHSFFFFSPATVRPPIVPPRAPTAAERGVASSHRSSGFGARVSRWTPERRRAAVAPWMTTAVMMMAAGEGMGAGLSGTKAGGRGGVKGSKKNKNKKKRKGSKQGTLIPGPPRLETVPEDKLDQAYVFRQDRPGQ